MTEQGKSASIKASLLVIFAVLSIAGGFGNCS